MLCSRPSPAGGVDDEGEVDDHDADDVGVDYDDGKEGDDLTKTMHH